jgi:hypothetical protein
VIPSLKASVQDSAGVSEWALHAYLRGAQRDEWSAYASWRAKTRSPRRAWESERIVPKLDLTASVQLSDLRSDVI